MPTVQGVCSSCGKTIRRDSPVPITVICDCYKICPICGGMMEPYTPDLNPRVYRDETSLSLDPLGVAEKSETSAETFYICRNHRPPLYSARLPVEVRLE